MCTKSGLVYSDSNILENHINVATQSKIDLFSSPSMHTQMSRSDNVFSEREKTNICPIHLYVFCVCCVGLHCICLHRYIYAYLCLFIFMDICVYILMAMVSIHK